MGDEVQEQPAYYERFLLMRLERGWNLTFLDARRAQYPARTPFLCSLASQWLDAECSPEALKQNERDDAVQS